MGKALDVIAGDYAREHNFRYKIIWKNLDALQFCNYVAPQSIMALGYYQITLSNQRSVNYFNVLSFSQRKGKNDEL